jgi:hypothetical protein
MSVFLGLFSQAKILRKSRATVPSIGLSICLFFSCYDNTVRGAGSHNLGSHFKIQYMRLALPRLDTNWSI